MAPTRGEIQESNEQTHIQPQTSSLTPLISATLPSVPSAPTHERQSPPVMQITTQEGAITFSLQSFHPPPVMGDGLLRDCIRAIHSAEDIDTVEKLIRKEAKRRFITSVSERKKTRRDESSIIPGRITSIEEIPERLPASLM
ncbi:hypothetical protein ADUPG1_004272, partial [Aduncisulcus paluster]